MPSTRRVEGKDLVLGMPARWGAGFLLNSDGIYGLNEAAFGHSGWGGSFGFADPSAGLAAIAFHPLVEPARELGVRLVA